MPAQVIVTLILYALYAFLVGLSLLPSAVLVIKAAETLAAEGRWPAFAMTLGCALFVFYFAAVIVMGLSIRLLSMGIKPGRYPEKSLTMFRWLVYSGLYTVMTHYVLPVVPMSFLTNAFFRLVGCRMGRNVKLNTFMLNDSYLLTIGDDVVIGGQTDVSCHIYENGHLILQPIKIGSGTVIGAHCYISPGVTIGERCVVGLGSYVRLGKTIPDGSKLTSVAGVSLGMANRIEKGRL